MIIFDQSPYIVKWAAKILQVDGFGPCKTIAIADKDLEAVWVYSKYDGNQCEVAVASVSPKWCTRRNLKVLFSFPFRQMECHRITGIIRKDNQRAISLVERLGAIKEGELREYCLDKTNAVIFGMLKSECRWINGI